MSDAKYVACQLSWSDELPFPCPDFVCPVNTVQTGYPWAELPDVWMYAKYRNGFGRRTLYMDQYPPPGTIVRYNSSTAVTLTAYDPNTNQTESCTTSVTVPQLVPCGTVNVTVPPGTYTKVGVFEPYKLVMSGTLYKMKGVLQSGLRGRGSITSRLWKGSDRYSGSLVFKANRTKGALNNLRISSPFSAVNPSDALQVNLDVRNVTGAANNFASYVVYCQEAVYSYSTPGGGQGR
jgi:hypothetical protein